MFAQRIANYLARIFLLTGILTLTGISCKAEPITVVYPASEVGEFYRAADIVELLQRALSVTESAYGEFQLVPSGEPLTEKRQLVELEEGKQIDVLWSSPSKEKDSLLRVIPIPLRKGLLSYRIVLENRLHPANLSSMSSLQQQVTGMGIGWEDVTIFEHSHIPLNVAKYQNLFKLLEYHRIDIFPRGVTEVFEEYKHFSEIYTNIKIEEDHLLYYPFPYFLYVNKTNHQLARRIEEGLSLMMEDGSFDEIFWKYHKDSIKKARLADRKVIRLKNPALEKRHLKLMEYPALWFDPSQMKKLNVP